MLSRFLALLTFAPLALSAREALDRPNIVIVLVDDSGYGDYSHTGNPTTNTPNISRMVAEGANFPQFYVASPACSASRYGVLTGRYAARSGLGSWVIGPESARYLHPKEITLANGLKSRGYATGIFGKWHLGTPNARNAFTPDALPLAHGFDEWIGTNVSADYDKGLDLIRSDASGSSPTKGYTILRHDFAFDAPAQESLTKLYADNAIAFIKRNKDRPFFAYVTPNQPHLPVHASAEFRGRSPRGEYGDAIEEIDANVGRIRETLKAEGIEKNTLVIYASDNGPWIRFDKTKKHPMYGEARFKVGSALPFRDGKGSDWEGGVRVPGIFCWPGVIAPATVVRGPAATLDILPTVFALAGVPLPADRKIDGRDIRPLLAPKDFPGKVPDSDYYYLSADNMPVGVRSGPWKLLESTPSQVGPVPGLKASKTSPLLFQVEWDFSERLNLAEEHADEVARLQKRLAERRRSFAQEGTFWGAPKPDRPDTEE